ncbi:hypothetical protein sos41_38320 [Alphaproteobacteria bacterium SO-S41]|nr:hypothetical protein sos41_38320 [Alphaproteobacteria bacterium SO-S41]
MTIGLIVRLTTKPGKGAEFEKAFAVQAEGVRKNEPGNKLYQLLKPADQEDTYVVMELYDDAAAIQAHRDAPHMVANRPIISELIAPGTQLERYEAL